MMVTHNEEFPDDKEKNLDSSRKPTCYIPFFAQITQRGDTKI